VVHAAIGRTPEYEGFGWEGKSLTFIQMKFGPRNRVFPACEENLLRNLRKFWKNFRPPSSGIQPEETTLSPAFEKSGKNSYHPEDTENFVLFPSIGFSEDFLILLHLCRGVLFTDSSD
jgi:hypothetical protein